MRLRLPVLTARFTAVWAFAIASLVARAELQLVVLSPHNEAIREEFERGFSRWHAAHGEAVDIDWRMVGFIRVHPFRSPSTPGSPTESGSTSSSGVVESRTTKWRRSTSPILTRSRARSSKAFTEQLAGIELRAPDFAWYGAAISSFGILQNLRVQGLARLPSIQRWEDLARPELKGWVGAGDPRGSGTMHVMFESFLQARGWDEGWGLLARVAGNARRFDRISSTTAKDAAVGETAYALAIDFYAFTQIAAAGKTNLSFLLPVDFAAVNPDGIAILRGAPNREMARR